MQSPKFSIIVPMYNVEKFIARALESAINQSFKDIEIICVDDCGQDKSIEIAKEFAKKDERIKIVQNEENLKLYLARANGVKHAQGEYILSLDGDDFLHKDTCLKCYEILEQNKQSENNEIDFIMFNLFRQDEKDGEFHLCKVVDKTQTIDDHTFEAIYFGQDTHYFNVVVKCVKREIYLKALDFANVTRKLIMGEDILVSMALLGVSKRIVLLDEGLYYYYFNENSATKTDEPSKTQENIENLNFVIAKFVEFTSKKDELYRVFLWGLIRILENMHIVREKSQKIRKLHQKRIDNGYPKWLARLILSLQKKPFKIKKNERELYRFINKHKDLFAKSYTNFSLQVSIIVPIYNVASYLKECLQSIVAQSYENLDIILIDDGSDDESLKIALNFAENDERIFVISKPNGGQATARNFGLEFIKGSALRTFFDDGDISHSLNMTNDSKEIFRYAQNDKIKVSQNDKEKAFQTNTSIQSLSQTHSFERSYKSIDTQELRAHFTQIKHNFIKSDLERINDFITQELPQNALIHFVDSDDYITQDCVAKCVQVLLEKDLDIIVHNIKHFYEENKSFKQGEFLQNLRQNTYESGLKLLKENRLYSFYFSVQGLFKASILNRYALRFTEGIYHEDHDFGTLLFCLAGKISYTNEPLYIYRQRTNSIITAQKNTAFPSKLPSFLEPLRADFKDYKALRAYFKSFCFVLVGFNIWEFFRQKSEQNAKFQQEFRDFFEKTALAYMKIFKSPLTPDTMGVKELLRKMNFSKSLVWREFFKDLHRQPKKIRFITHIKYLLSRKN